MKAFAAAVVLLAVLAMAEARPTMRVLNKKTTKAEAKSVAIAVDGGEAHSGAKADASNGGDATAASLAVAAGPDAEAKSWADSKATDWAKTDAKSKAIALGEDSKATSDASAYGAGEVTSKADSKAVAYGAADATSNAVAKGDATAKATAYAVAKPEPKEHEHHYVPYYYYPAEETTDDGDDHTYVHHGYYYGGYYGYKAVDPTVKYPYHAHYVVDEESDDVEYTPVKHVDEAILAYYAQKVYDYGCYEGKYYRCTYDDSCGECPYGYFCGEKTTEVCEDVEVWTKKCDAAPAKKCVPDLTACGTGFCKYNEKCAADYYWCGAKWCTPKYTCVAVESPKKCVWELKDGKKVQTCTEYTPEQCGKEPCAIGYKCSEDPCTFVKSVVKKCADKAVPVCVAYDVPTYKTLFSKCGPGYCHPGYKCESFDHDSCVVKVVHHHVHVGYKPHDYVTVDPEDPEDSDDGDDHVHVPYKPHYPVDDAKEPSTAHATATAKSVATPDGVVAYTDVDASATGDGVAKGNADATASNGDSKATSWGGVTASAPETSASVKTDSSGDYAVAKGDASADYSSDK